MKFVYPEHHKIKNGYLSKSSIHDDISIVEKKIEKWLSIFSDGFYRELQRVGKSDQDNLINNTIDISNKFNIPLVATNNVRFLDEMSYEAHEARVCIQESFTLDDPRRPRHYTSQQYLRSQKEMGELFSDIPESLTNTLKIAQRCNIEFTLEIIEITLEIIEITFEIIEITMILSTCFENV